MNRVIKKYPNRRLYDTEESRYITLADIRELVLRDISFEGHRQEVRRRHHPGLY